MTSRIFITKNLDTLFIAVQSLDPYTTDNLSINSQISGTSDLFQVRNTSLMKYRLSTSIDKVDYIIIILEKILETLDRTEINNSITCILKEITRHPGNLSQCSCQTQNYIKRFIIHYGQSVEPYLIGENKYVNSSWLVKVSLVNIFLLYKLSKPYGCYNIISYILYNNSSN
jgi:hypothetical protein